MAVEGASWMAEIVKAVKSVPDYQIGENDQLSKDGKSIICTVCHETKRVKKECEVLGTFWGRGENGGCACERKAAEERRRQNEREEFMAFWNGETYLNLLGKRYQEKTFSALKTTDNHAYEAVKEKCMNYADSIEVSLRNGWGMYIFSAQSGNGKTTLLACIRNALIEKQVPVVFIGYSNLIELAGGKGDSTLSWDGLKDVPVLMIDDIGSEDLRKNERRGEWVNSIFDDLIGYRYDNLLCTLFSSNFSIRQLQAVRGYKAKTCDRIVEMATRAYEIQGTSFRGQDWEMKT